MPEDLPTPSRSAKEIEKERNKNLKIENRQPQFHWL